MAVVARRGDGLMVCSSDRPVRGEVPNGTEDRAVRCLRSTIDRRAQSNARARWPDPDRCRFREQLRAIVPNEDVRVATVDNSLVITGSVTSAEQAEEVRRLAVRLAPEPGAVINHLKVTTPNQINLRVRIAEVRRDVLKVFGFNWDALAKFGDFSLGFAVGSPTNLLNNVVAGATTNSFFAGNNDISNVIDALSREGLVTILAEPNLTAMSGETASFLSGGEFPFAVPQQNGTPAVEFKQFGVSLAFTPTILGGERISMRVRPEVSQTSTVIKIGDSLVPSISTRRAETTVELGSGQTFAIAGLLQTNKIGRAHV